MSDASVQLLQFAPLAICLVINVLSRRTEVFVSRPLQVFFSSLIALAAWATASELWSVTPDRSRQQALLFIFVAAFLITTIRFRWLGKATLQTDLKCIYFVIFTVQFAGVVRGLTGAIDARDFSGRLQGILANPNYTGFMAALGLCLMVALVLAIQSAPARLVLILSGGPLILSLLWSGSRGALLGVLVYPLATVFASRTWSVRRVPAVYFAALSIAALYALGVIDALTDARQYQRMGGGLDFTSGRRSIWQATLERWGDHLILGTGHASTQELDQVTGLNAHNLGLAVGVELGLIGITLLTLLIVSVWYCRARSGPLAPLAGILACVLVFEMTEASLLGFGNPTAITVWLLLAAIACGSSGHGQLTRAKPSDAR